MVNENGWILPRKSLKFQTPESLIILSILYYVILKDYTYVCSYLDSELYNKHFRKNL